MNLEPLSDRVIIKPIEEVEEKIGSIVVPDTAKEKPNKGIVVAIGPGRTAKDGKKLSMAVKVDDKVLYESFSGNEVDIEGEEYLIMRESEIVAIIE